jgi:GAF domain-containing protein
MLRRGHRLAVGREGLVGYVAASGRPRIALDVGQDAVYFNNPDLPMTRSEMALPLKLGERVIGVLDVQSRTASAFSQEDVAILQILADQLAVSIENARLIETSRQSLREMESLYGMQLQQGWQKRLGNQPLVYRLEGGRVRPETTEAPALPPDNAAELEIPIELRGLRLGALRLRRDGDRTGWSQQEIELARETVAHMAQALENARLVAEIENRATQEEQINQIVARTQSTLGLDSVMRTAVQEIVRVANVSRVQIRLGGPAADAAAPDPTSAGPANGNGGAE